LNFLSLVGLALAATPAPAVSQAVAAQPEVEAQIGLFSAWLDGQIEIRGLPGVVAGDDLVWARGFGHADVAEERSMETDSGFRMPSHSKLFTAAAIMQLREQGRLRLDDPVVEYLPWFAFEQAAPDDPPVTIEHLLTLSSGPPWEAGSHWTDLEFPTTAEVRELMAERRAPFSPEVRWKYSNLAYTIAGMVVEEVSGMSWADYLRQNIFDPLGMDASSVDEPDPLLATPYGSRMPDGSRMVFPFVDAPGQGIGFSVQRVDGKLFVGHGGGYPGYTTNTLIQPDSKVGVIALTNTTDSNPGQIASEFMSTVGEAVAAATTQEAWDPAWARFAGLYGREGRGRTQVLVMNERLVMMNPWSSSVGEPTELEPVGDGTFRMVAPTGGGPVGEIVRFVEEDGEVVRMITGDSYVVRIR
jgi:CubicO group peptidase (beta-lactamase class C family)